MNPDRIDWSQVWYSGPTRVFSDAELARAGDERPSRTLAVTVLINLAIIGQAVLQWAPSAITAQLTALLIGIAAAGLTQAKALWRQPTRRSLTLRTLVAAGLFVLFALGFKWRVDDPLLRGWLIGTAGVATLMLYLALWFVTVYRSHQIASRLRELDEHERALAMARQLAAAQIQPHFIFNTLAALQHWVDTGDARAAPLLTSLTGYLRATLPLFDRAQLTLGEEVDAVRRYLEVMQARLGARLHFEIAIEPPLQPLPLPPGLLLTLVENAVEHGVQPSLHGAELHLRAQRAADGQVAIDVTDSGVGLPAAVTEGLGLRNSRERLRQVFGDAAHLSLQRRPEGGTLARITLPWNPS